MNKNGAEEIIHLVSAMGLSSPLAKDAMLPGDVDVGVWRGGGPEGRKNVLNQQMSETLQVSSALRWHRQEKQSDKRT